MIGKKTINSTPIPMAKVKEVLNNYVENFEPNYEQNVTIDHVSQFSKLSLDETEKLIAELESEMDLKPKYAVKIADMMVKDLDDLRLLFSKEPLKLKNEDMKRILEIVDKYREFEEEEYDQIQDGQIQDDQEEYQNELVEDLDKTEDIPSLEDLDEI
ncbi:MAG: RNA polymerase Rpb4 family protein [Methanobrevibacter sp.]|jgi:DNA-directed RNA polymerase subunit F|nr:RNA polymerase Rpb4 family protein [Candidatus Methanoflexus mossambicus]